MGCFNLCSFLFFSCPLFFLPRSPSMDFETCQSKNPSRWQAPMTLLEQGNGAVFMQKFSEWAKQIMCVFLLANVTAAGTILAWCWGLSAFQSHWTERGHLASVWQQAKQKRLKMRPRLHCSKARLSQAGVLCHQDVYDYPCLSLQTLPPAWWLIYPLLTVSDYVAASELLWN